MSMDRSWMDSSIMFEETDDKSRTSQLVFSVAIAMLTAVLSMLLSSEAVSQTPYAGQWYWDGAATCAPNYDGENVALEIKNGKLLYYESSCTIRRTEKLSSHGYRFDLACRGEGEVWRKTMMFALLPISKINHELLLGIDLRSGFVTAYRRCP